MLCSRKEVHRITYLEGTRDDAGLVWRALHSVSLARGGYPIGEDSDGL